MKLDLETLKRVKFTFDIHSDNSTMCHGYHSLCRMIEEAENKVNKNIWHKVIAIVKKNPCKYVKGFENIEEAIKRNGSYYEKCKTKKERG